MGQTTRREGVDDSFISCPFRPFVSLRFILSIHLSIHPDVAWCRYLSTNSSATLLSLLLGYTLLCFYYFLFFSFLFLPSSAFYLLLCNLLSRHVTPKSNKTQLNSTKNKQRGRRSGQTSASISCFLLFPLKQPEYPPVRSWPVNQTLPNTGTTNRAPLFSNSLCPSGKKCLTSFFLSSSL